MEVKIEAGFTPIKFFAVDNLLHGKKGYSSFHNNYLVFADDNDDIKYDFVSTIEFLISKIIGKKNYASFYDYFYG